MNKNGTTRKTPARRNKDARERLKAALAISKLLHLYGLYAEKHGFDYAIMEAGIHALNCEIEAVLKLLGDNRNGRKPWTMDETLFHTEDKTNSPV